MKYPTTKIIFLFFTLLLAACKSKDVITPPVVITVVKDTVILNPTGYSPLAATIAVETSAPSKISIRVVGKNGAETDVINDFTDVSTTHEVPVLGLYADYDNIVELVFKDAAGSEGARKSYTVKTGPLPVGVFPAITIDTKKTGMAEGLNLVSYFGYSGSPAPQMPFVFDAFGEVRWYLDFRTSPVLNTLFYDNGPEKLQNDNLYFGDGATHTIYEVDFLGKTINTWEMPGYEFHHNVQEKPNGNFLVTVNKIGNTATTEDFIIEIDRNTKQIIRTWDLRQSLQNFRNALTGDPVDWFHANALIYDESDNTIIVSGRTQGVVKLDQNNNVVWILSCHRGWGTAGNGADLKNFLLQPLDKNNQPITDPAVLDGSANHPDFEWCWYQHSPQIMPNGNLILFDNGSDLRNFVVGPKYSRAVEYDINKTNKTIKQVWEYGKERGVATYSKIVSDVDYLPASNHVIFSPGAVDNVTKYGKMIELDYATKDVLFEATLTPLQTYFGVTLHRTERMKLY